ncbi:MAG: HD domain-containing protein [Lentimicrobium sp.]|nr:HD domain-containing protein [Lentimicrobium sp.]
MGSGQSLKRKIINDPVHGFITISGDLLFSLVEHPLVQRLRRIRQLGLTSYVYPGALHTRFHHAIGAMHLMQEAIDTLRLKGIDISDDEGEATLAAILLHDIGHGPYSHALEHSIVSGISHEEISLIYMKQLNSEYDGKLEMAIRIFTNDYPKKFLHQLVSGQLDTDRLDYLKRDSFFTGVSEGVINTERIIKMLTVKDDELMVEDKGIYSIEKFIVARRLMYWQVYYHKTVVAAENMLINLLKRAKSLILQGESLFATPSLLFFLSNKLDSNDFYTKREVPDWFAQLDDYDILSAMKVWVNNPDPVLSFLSKGLISRRLFRIIIRNEPFADIEIQQVKNAIQLSWPNLNQTELSYFIGEGTITNNAYNPVNDKIKLLYRNGQVNDIADSSDQINVSLLSGTISKHFLTFPKMVEVF